MAIPKHPQQYINGAWREGGSHAVLENHNPYNQELIQRYQGASAQDLNDAVAAAKTAQKAWQRATQREKSQQMQALAQVLERRQADLYDILRAECGSVDLKCGAEFYGTLDHIRMAAHFPYQMDGKIIRSEMAQARNNYIIKKPKGVIGVIAPWNFPFLLAMRSVVPAVATGNAVVLRPSTTTPASAFFIAELFDEAGFPPGVVNVISGLSTEIGDALVTHPDIALISFTGSTEVGRHIGELCGKHLKDVSLELGGNSSLCVLPDADLKQAAKAAIWGSYCHAGQICMAVNRVIVHQDVYAEFVDLAVQAALAVKVGDPTDKAVFLGPMTTAQQVQQVEATIAQTIAAGATVALEGKTEGQLMHPWVLSDVSNDMLAAKCELFGPVCSILPASSEQEMLDMANATDYGLSSAVFSGDLYRGMQFAQNIETGMVFVNDQSINEEAHIIFGGEKDSGIGRFNGQWVVDKFTTEQRIGVQEEDRVYF